MNIPHTCAQANYPQFSAPFQPKELRSINQLVVGDTADIQVVVVQELSTRSYIGCPTDSKRIPDAIEGKEAVCPKCGNIVKPVLLQWAMYLAGDVTDEIIVSFPPSITNRPTERMVIVAQGVLGDNEEFVVYRWTLPSESPKALTATDRPLSTYFKPVESGTPASATPIPSLSTPISQLSQPIPSLSQSISPTQSPTVTELDSGHSQIAGDSGDRTQIGKDRPMIAADRPQMGGDRAQIAQDRAMIAGRQPIPTASKPIASKPVGKTAAKLAAPRKKLNLSASSPTAPTASSPSTPTAPISLVASSEQATLPTAAATAPASVPATTAAPAEQAQVTGSKIVDGVSEPALKFAKLSGLVKKSYTEFKVAFETNFPGHDMVKVLEAAHCTVVDDKVAFIGGS